LSALRRRTSKLFFNVNELNSEPLPAMKIQVLPWNADVSEFLPPVPFDPTEAPPVDNTKAQGPAPKTFKPTQFPKDWKKKPAAKKAAVIAAAKQVNAVKAAAKKAVAAVNQRVFKPVNPALTKDLLAQAAKFKAKKEKEDALRITYCQHFHRSFRIRNNDPKKGNKRFSEEKAMKLCNTCFGDVKCRAAERAKASKGLKAPQLNTFNGQAHIEDLAYIVTNKHVSAVGPLKPFKFVPPSKKTATKKKDDDDDDEVKTTAKPQAMSTRSAGAPAKLAPPTAAAVQESNTVLIVVGAVLGALVLAFLLSIWADWKYVVSNCTGKPVVWGDSPAAHV